MLTSGLFSRKSHNKGFTLIELMIVVAIIGILAAIAIPQFNKYRKNAMDAAAKSDLASLALSMENYYINYNTYTTTLPSDFVSSADVVITVTSVSTTNFTATASHTGSTSTYTWRSQQGGLWN